MRQEYRQGKEQHWKLRLKRVYKFSDSKHYYERSEKQALTKKGGHTKGSLQSLTIRAMHVMWSQVWRNQIAGASILKNKVRVEGAMILHRKTTTFGVSSITIWFRPFLCRNVLKAYVVSL
jgi:hypothetical protein